MSLRARWAGWGARFDTRALQAYRLPAGAGEPDWPALRTWCLAAPAQRYAVAIASPDGADAAVTDAGPRAAGPAAAMALQLDGTHALLACRSTAARLGLRLGVKWQDLRTAGAVSATLPATRIWDSGRARGDEAALARFRPRRPTLIVVDSGPPAARLAALSALQAQAAGFVHPVRVLWLLPGAAPAGAVGLAWA